MKSKPKRMAASKTDEEILGELFPRKVLNEMDKVAHKKGPPPPKK